MSTDQAVKELEMVLVSALMRQYNQTRDAKLAQAGCRVMSRSNQAYYKRSAVSGR
jgi:hypothetical protein